MIKNTINYFGRLCAYSYIFKVLSVLIHGGDISEQVKTGRTIALLGIFCPFFWYALFTGASHSELAFHATHSSLVFLFGIVVMFTGLKKQKK